MLSNTEKFFTQYIRLLITFLRLVKNLAMCYNKFSKNHLFVSILRQLKNLFHLTATSYQDPLNIVEVIRLSCQYRQIQ